MSKLVYLSGLDGADVAEVAAQLNSIIDSMQAMPELQEYKIEQALAKTVLTFLDDEDSREAVIGNAAQKSALYADYYRSLLESLGNLPAIVGRSTLVNTDVLANLKNAVPAGFQPDPAKSLEMFRSFQRWYQANHNRADLRSMFAGKSFYDAVRTTTAFISREVADNLEKNKSTSPEYSVPYRIAYIRGINADRERAIREMRAAGVMDFNPFTAAAPAAPAPSTPAAPAAPARPAAPVATAPAAPTQPATIPPNQNMSNIATAVATAPAGALANPAIAAKGPDTPKTEEKGLQKIWAEHKTIIIIAVAVLLIGAGAVIFWPKDKPKKKKKNLAGLNGRRTNKRRPAKRRTTATSKRKKPRRRRLNGTPALAALPPATPLTLAGPRKKRKKSSRKYRVYAKPVGMLAGRKAKRPTTRKKTTRKK